MADTDLHFARLDLEIRFADRRNGTGCQAYSDAPAVVDCFLSRRYQFIEGSAQSGLRSAHFPHQNFSGDAPTFFPLSFWSGRNIVVCYHRFDLDAVEFGELSRHFYVQIISGIVAVETGYTFAAVSRLERIQKCLGGRRSENLADGNGIAKIFSNVTDERRLVSRTAAGL